MCRWWVKISHCSELRVLARAEHHAHQPRPHGDLRLRGLQRGAAQRHAGVQCPCLLWVLISCNSWRVSVSCWKLSKVDILKLILTHFLQFPRPSSWQRPWWADTRYKHCTVGSLVTGWAGGISISTGWYISSGHNISCPRQCVWINIDIW